MQNQQIQNQQQSMMAPRFPGMVSQMQPNQLLLRQVPPRSAMRGMLQFRMQQQQQQQQQQQPEQMQLPSAALQQMQAQLQNLQPGLRMFPPVPANISNQVMLQPQFHQQQQQQVVQRHVMPSVSNSTNRGLFHFFQSIA